MSKPSLRQSGPSPSIPMMPTAMLTLGNILVFAGRPEEAIELIEKAMRLNPRYPPSYLRRLGFAYHRGGTV